MKRIILSLIVLGTALAATAQIPVPNGSFESWQQEDITVVFPPYSSTSNNLAASEEEAPNVFPVSGASGTDAVRLEAAVVAGDTMPGVMGIGEFFPNAPGAAWVGQPDSFRVWLRYDIQSGDNALIAFHFFAGGTQIGGNQLFFLVGTNDTWHTETFALSALPAASDSIGVLIVAGDFANATPGTWLEIDSMGFVGGAPLPNAGFDVTDSIGYTDPEGWLSPNYFAALLNSTPIATRSSNAAAGDYALRIETVETDTGNGLDTAGYAFLAQEIGDNGPEGGIPVPAGAEAPIRLTGQYQYHPVGTDTAIAYLVMTRYDLTLGQRDTVGEYGIALPPAGNYTEFEILTPVTADADSFMLAFGSSDFDGDLSQSVIGIGSWLLLDALVFDTTSQDTITDGLRERLPDLPVRMYPNPVRERLTLKAESSTNRMEVTVLDLTGKTVMRRTWDPRQAASMQLDVQTLQPGYYILHCQDQTSRAIFRQRWLRL